MLIAYKPIKTPFIDTRLWLIYDEASPQAPLYVEAVKLAKLVGFRAGVAKVKRSCTPDELKIFEVPRGTGKLKKLFVTIEAMHKLFHFNQYNNAYLIALENAISDCHAET